MKTMQPSQEKIAAWNNVQSVLHDISKVFQRVKQVKKNPLNISSDFIGL